MGQKRGLAWAVGDVFTATNFGTAAIAALTGYILNEVRYSRAMFVAEQLVCTKLLFKEQITLDVRSVRRAFALIVQASARLRQVCLPPLVAGSRRDLWPLP
jgi:hypothetical protein